MGAALEDSTRISLPNLEVKLSIFAVAKCCTGASWNVPERTLLRDGIGDCPSQDLQIKQQLLLVRLTQTRKGYLRKRDVSQEAKLTEVTTSHVGSPFPISSPHQDWTCRAWKRSGSSPDQQGEIKFIILRA